MKSTFDLTTHIRDSKTGNIVRTQPYRLHESKLHGRIFERPVGSGICYFEDGSRAPTISEVKRINEEQAKAAPRTLTTADLAELEARWKQDKEKELLEQATAMAEAKTLSRIDSLVAARLSTVLEKLNITGEKAALVTEAVLSEAPQQGAKE